MRRYQKQLTATAASAALLAAIGAAMAQQTPVPPDQGQTNNERQTGIQNNTNNSYKTFPETLKNPTAATNSRTDLGTPNSSSTLTRSAARVSADTTTSNTTTNSSTSTTTTSDSGYANNSTTAPTRAPRSDRN